MKKMSLFVKITLVWIPIRIGLDPRGRIRSCVHGPGGRADPYSTKFPDSDTLTSESVTLTCFHVVSGVQHAVSARGRIRSCVHGPGSGG